MPTPDSAAAPEQVKVQAWVPVALAQSLEDMAAVAERSMAGEVRLALKAWVEAADKDPKP